MKGSESHQQLVGDARRHGRMMPMPVTITGVSCVSTFWICATFFLLAGLVVAGGFPNWFHNRVEIGPQSRELDNTLSSVDLGLYYLCYNLTSCAEESCTGTCRDLRLCGCTTYLNYNPPLTVNSTSGAGSLTRNTGMVPTGSVTDIAILFSGGIVYGFGCLMLLISLLIGGVAYCKPRCGWFSLFLFAFILQAIAGICLVVGLALTPVFFGSDFAEQFCGPGADIYTRGQCNIGWSLFLSMVVTACSLYLPALAIFSMNISDGLNAHICC